MKHQQILDKLAARHMVQSADEDLARLTWEIMTRSSSKNRSIEEQTEILISKLLPRWNCILTTNDKHISEHYKQRTYLALAVLLHKYGYKYEPITTNALKSIDLLNKDVVLSDDFYRKSDDIKAFLATEPVQLKRRPAMPESITFYRPKDVISIELDNKYYGAYIHSLTAPNENPIIEFYNKVFDEPPTMEELKKCKAKGSLYNDGTECIAKYSVRGMKFLPDLANQVKLISSCENEPPSNNHLIKPVELYSVQDIFWIQNIIRGLFK